MINLYTLRTVSAFDLPSGYELYVTLKIKKYIYNSKKEEINSICINFNRYRTKKQIHQSKSKILPNIGQYKTKIYLLYKTIIFDFVFCMQRILQIFKVCIPFLTV